MSDPSTNRDVGYLRRLERWLVLRPTRRELKMSGILLSNESHEEHTSLSILRGDIVPECMFPKDRNLSQFSQIDEGNIFTPVPLKQRTRAGHIPPEFCGCIDTSNRQEQFTSLRRLPLTTVDRIASDLYVWNSASKSWSIRWVSLVENTVYIFDSRLSEFPEDMLPLGDFAVIKEDSPVYRKDRVFPFWLARGCVHSQLFASSNAALRHEWLQAFRCAELIHLYQSTQLECGERDNGNKDELTFLDTHKDELVVKYGEEAFASLRRRLEPE